MLVWQVRSRYRFNSDERRKLVDLVCADGVVNTGFSNVACLSTGQGYGGETSRGIRVGSLVAEAVKTHGVPESALGTTRGRVHRHGDLLLEVSTDDRVRGWTLFTIDE